MGKEQNGRNQDEYPIVLVLAPRVMGAPLTRLEQSVLRVISVKSLT